MRARRATVGGGSLPGETLPSFGLALAARSADRLLAALRAGDPAVVGRIEDGRVVLDLRTVDPASDDELAAALAAALRAGRRRADDARRSRRAVTVVVGTAGHIDHGKTTLLRALTGIDADRLPEERRRGMTIDVGYAHLRLPDGDVLDFVDVPGHDRLVGNMLVGAGEIDAVLLVVAADDGPRAQTREHVELLDALGLRHAVVAVTKVDAVDEARVPEVADGGRGRSWRRRRSPARPIVAVSGVTGDGVERSRRGARRTSGIAPGPTAPERPGRRAWRSTGSSASKGRGTVVTGTLRGGPAGPRGVAAAGARRVAVRARELQARGRDRRARRARRAARRERRRASSGPRSARGAVLTDDPAVVATDRLLVLLRPTLDLRRGRSCGGTCRRPEPRSGSTSGRRRSRASSGARGATSTSFRAAAATAILRLAAPIAAASGDRFVLRRPSPAEPLAGGRVLDPRPPTGAAWRRATAAEVRALAPWRLARPSAPRPSSALHGALPRSRPEVGALPPGRRRPAGRLVLAPPVASAVIAEALAAVGCRPATGSRSPSCARVSGAPCAGARRSTRPPPPRPRGALVEALVGAGRLARTGDLVHLPEPGRRPRRRRCSPPWTGSRPPSTRPRRPALPEAARAPAARRPGCAPSRRRDGSSASTRTSRGRRRRSPACRPSRSGWRRPARSTPAALRDATGTSRKYVMALLEELNRRGVLARTPDGHVRGPRAAR